MIYKPYAVFGYAMVLANTEASEIKETNLGDDGLVTSGYYFVTKGCIKTTVKENGQSLGDRPAGYLNLEQVPPANSDLAAQLTLQLSFEESTEWVCIAHKYNRRLGLPELESFVIDPEGTKEFENNSNLFLVRGQVKVKTKTFTGPCSIRIRSGDCVATNTSVEKCYGLIIKGL